MRRTPPVVVQVQPQRAVQAGVSVISALATAGLAAWAVSHQPHVWPALLAIPFSAAVVVWAWREAAALPRRLRWDGEAWWLTEPRHDDETVVQLAVLIDLDFWLLLRASPGPRWLALSRQQHAPVWGALRATLFAAPTKAPTNAATKKVTKKAAQR
jgi:hypothetical protein